MKTYLKVKIKSLAEESRIIKIEEQRAKRDYRRYAERRQGATAVPSDKFWGLRAHRLEVVRPICRASLIAYAYLRGRTYDSVEHAPRPVDSVLYKELWDRVGSMVRRFGDDDTVTDAQIEAWRDVPQPERKVERLQRTKVKPTAAQIDGWRQSKARRSELRLQRHAASRETLVAAE